MRDTTRRSLERFIEKAQKLESGRFAQFLLSQELSLKISRSSAEKPARVSPVEPDDDAIDAFLLTFRFFVQDGDGISFRCLADHVSTDPVLSERWKQEFMKVHQSVVSWLSESSLFTAFGHTPTLEEIRDVFLYGDLAHMNERRRGPSGQTPRQQFETWRQEKYLYPVYHHEFLQFLSHMLQAILYVAMLSKEELQASV